MSQFYVGVKQVFAWPEEKRIPYPPVPGQPPGEEVRQGYHVVYRYGEPDAYHSWSPKEEFEKFYLPQGNDPSRITQGMVEGFFGPGTEVCTVKGKMTVVDVELKNGTLFAESSACVDPANYNEGIGRDICIKRAEDRVWGLLGFALQWAINGLRK